MKRFVLGAFCVALGAYSAFAAARTVTWELPEGWDAEVSYPEIDGYRAILADGFGRRNGLGEVGEPDLPFKAFTIDVKKGGTVQSASVEAVWTEVKVEGEQRHLLPMPIVEMVKVGDPIVMPELSEAYETFYPTNHVDVGTRRIYRNRESFTLRVTPFKWDGEKKTLYRASKLRVEVKVEGEGEQGKLKLPLSTSTSSLHLSSANAEEQAANFIIIAPHKFLSLWQGYAEFRKNSRGGRGLTFKVKDLNEIYEEFKPAEHVNGYTKKPDYELCIHKWLEKMYAQTDAKGEPVLQYILLGGTPAKYSFNPEEHIPSRRFSAVATNGYMSDTYYGCMDKFDKSGKPTTEGEVWDYEGDGVYMAELQPAGWIKCSAEVTKSVDWDPDVAVFRFPLMSAVKDGTGAGVYQTAEQIMDTFTNRIAWAESDEFPEAARNVYANTGGTMHHGWGRGETRVEVTGEREFFDGGLNVFDPAHATPYQDSEIYSRHHVPDFFSVYRGWKDNSTIHTCNYNPNTYAEIYSKSGEIVNNLAHGWARGADPMSAPQAYSATGFYRAYIIGNSCDCGMFDYCPSGSYGITNCICLGEAPVLNPDPRCGALVSYTNARFGYGDNYTVGGSDCMDHYINAGWAGFDGLGNYVGEQNAAQAHISACQQFQRTGYPSCQTVNGVCEMEIICHGDPLVRLTPQTNAVNSTDFLCVRDFSSDATATDGITFSRNSTSAGFYLTGNGGKVTLDGEGRYRSTRETVLTNVAELVWEVEGGAGRNGIRFVNRKGDLTLPGNAKRYFGQSFKNVGDIVVSGGNVTLDFPAKGSVAECADFKRLSFVSPTLSESGDFNVLRTRQVGFFPAGQCIVVVSNRLDLQTRTIGAPIYATNAVVRVSPNPYWDAETFSQKVVLANSELVSNSDKFYLAGTLDLFGAVKMSGASAVRLTGANVFALHDGATLEVTAPVKDGTSAGSLSVTGNGTVRFLAATAHTLGTTIADGATLEVASGEKMPGNTLVASGGVLRPSALPMSGAKTIAVGAGGTLSLPVGSGKNGIYQLVNPLATTITIDPGATVVDEATGEPLTGTIKNGCFLSDAESLTWNGSQGSAWDFTHKNWKDGAGQSVAYQDGYPLAFKDVGAQDDVLVALEADVRPGFMDFQNTKPYRFEARAPHEIEIGSLVTSSDIAFGTNVSLKSETLIAATAGNLAFGDVETPELQMAAGTSLRVSGTASAPVREIRKLRFTFTQAYNGNQRVAISELHLFEDGAFMTLPAGTLVRDSAGQEIRITGAKGDGYDYTWVKGQGLYADNESLKALIDGKLTGNNKWWLGNKAFPAWFEVEFPEAHTQLSDYRFHMADYGVRNPKAWTISYASAADSQDYKTIRTCTVTDGNKEHWYDKMPLLDAGGFVKVMAGAKLYASGAFAADLDLSEDGAVLAVLGTNALSRAGELMRLALPAEGKVQVVVDEAEAHKDWKPLLTGFNLSEVDFLKFNCEAKAAALKLVDGDVYIVTAGVAQSPFKLFMDDGDYSWRSATWVDSTGSFDGWDALNARSDGEAQLHVTGNATLVADVGGSFGTIKVLGDEMSSLTIVTNGVTDVMTPLLFDASEYKGALRVEMPLGAAAVLAGPDTTFACGEMLGNLAVPENGRVTLAEGTAVAAERLSMHETSELRRLGTLDSVSLANLPKGVYSFENATLLGGLMNGNVTVKISAGERVVVYGRSENEQGKNALSYIVNGGELVFQPNAPRMEWNGNLTMTDGAFSFVAQGGDGTLNLKGGAINVSGGTFDAASSVLNLVGWTTFAISNGAVFQTRGFSQQGASGSIAIANATLEIGPGGMDSGTVQSFAMNGGKLVATGAGTTFKQEIAASGDISIAARDGASMLMNMVDDGTGVVTFGAAEGGFGGTIMFKGSYSVPAQYKVASGTLNHINTKFSDTLHCLVEKPSAGATILCDVLDGDMKVDTYKKILYCGSWVTSLSDAEVKEFVKIRAPIGELADANWLLGRSGNYVQFKPLLIQNNSSFIGVSGNWSEMNWKNNFGGTFSKKFWTDDSVADAYVTYIQTATGTMTLDTDVSIGLMQITVGMNGNPTINANGYRLTVAGSVVLDNTQSYPNAKSIRFYGGEITFGSLTLNKVNNFELEGTVLGNVAVPSGGTYKQTAGTFGSITLPPTAKAVLGMAIAKDELSIVGIEYTNGTAESVVLTAKSLALDDPNASFDKAKVTVTNDLAYARWQSYAEAMRIASNKFAFEDDVTLDVGTVRDAADLPTNCFLKFRLTAAEMADIYTGVDLYTAPEGKTYSPEKVKVVDDKGATLVVNVTFENGKITARKTFDGGAIYATVTSTLADIKKADWRDASGRLLGTFDWSLVTDMVITNSNSSSITLTFADGITLSGVMKFYSASTSVVTLNFSANVSVNTFETDSASGKYCRLMASGTGALSVVDDFVINGHTTFQLYTTMSVRGIRDLESANTASKFQNFATLTLGDRGVNLARGSFEMRDGSTTVASDNAAISTVAASGSFGNVKLSAAAHKTLMADVVIDEPPDSKFGDKYVFYLNACGEGTVVLSKANLITGATTVSAGTLELGDNGALGTGGVTVSGGVLDIGTSRIANVVTLSGGKVKVTLTDDEVEMGTSLPLFGYTGTAASLADAVTIVDSRGETVSGSLKVVNNSVFFGDGVLKIAPGKTVELTAQSAAAIANVTGGGTLVCKGFLPSFSNLADANTWTGTVVLANAITLGNYYTFANIGNASSAIEIAGAVTGYLKVGGSCASAFSVTGTLHVNNGNSGASYAFTGPLAGDGLIKTSGSPTTKIYFTGDCSEFAGTINVAGGHCVLFAANTSATSASGKIIVSGKTVTIAKGKVWSAASGIDIKANATVLCDLGEVTGLDLAKKSVNGVPYAIPFFTGSVSNVGTIGVKGGAPTMPKGYTADFVTTGGIAFAVTAPAKAKFGAISLNLHNGTALTGAGNHGLYPVPLADWRNLKVANKASITVSGAKFTLSSSVSGYGLNNNPPDMIYKQYMDDSSSTRTITITGVPYAQYRLVVYYSTDTENCNFRPLKVNGDWYAGSTTSQTTANPTVKGRNEVWGHSGPNHNANAPAEGVNALMTDVYSGDVTLSFTRNGGSGARATPCAIQIVKVGEIVPTPVMFWLR